jgi:hypothetical protein
MSKAQLQQEQVMVQLCRIGQKVGQDLPLLTLQMLETNLSFLENFFFLHIKSKIFEPADLLQVFFEIKSVLRWTFL